MLIRKLFLSVFIFLSFFVFFSGSDLERRKPVIGISAGIYSVEYGSLKGKERQYVTDDYIKKIEAAGGVPIVLPMVENKAMMRAQIEMVDALILSGGQDVSPKLYGEKPTKLLGAVYPRRDTYDIEIIKTAYELKKPILGICRGIQVINVAFGGTLYQDVSMKSKKVFKHMQKESPENTAHSIDIKKDTLLFEIINTKKINVNSYHHQAVKQIAPGFVICAESKDGIIEAIYKPDYPFFLGVQWHPEMMPMNDAFSQKIFDAFVAAAKN